MTRKSTIEELRKQVERTLEGGGAERYAKQHEKGKLTARERIDVLMDSDTFVGKARFVTHRSTAFGLEK